MARWTGTWLSGLGAAGVSLQREGEWRGQRFGLPAAGPGSVASFNGRLGAVLIDFLVAALIRGLLRPLLDQPTRLVWGLIGFGVFAAMYAVLLPTTGQTLG